MKGCARSPYVIDSIERDGLVVYRHDPTSSVAIGSVDRAAFYQLKTMMQGVLARGTARSIARLAPYVAGKTGTSDNENDAWFVGFTNDVTVAVWLGYDNSDGKRRTLGGGATGGGVAVPIFEPVIQAVWAHVAPRTALAPPSPEAKRQLACKSIDLEFGRSAERGGGITECFRIDDQGRVIDTQHRLVSRASAFARSTIVTTSPAPARARKQASSAAGRGAMGMGAIAGLLLGPVVADVRMQRLIAAANSRWFFNAALLRSADFTRHRGRSHLRWSVGCSPKSRPYRLCAVRWSRECGTSCRRIHRTCAAADWPGRPHVTRQIRPAPDISGGGVQSGHSRLSVTVSPAQVKPSRPTPIPYLKACPLPRTR